MSENLANAVEEEARVSTTNVVEFTPPAEPRPSSIEERVKPRRRAATRKRRFAAATAKKSAEPAPQSGRVIAVKFLDKKEEPAKGEARRAAAKARSWVEQLLDPVKLKRTYLDLRMWNRSMEVDDYGFDRKYTDSIMPIFEFLYENWWRVEMTGLEHIPSKGPALIVANHSGVLPWDGAMVRVGIEKEHPAHRSVRLLALDMFTLLPVLAPMLARTGMVRACQENGERLLKSNELVGVFPEGVKGVGKYYKDRYKLARFGRGGFIRLAVRTGSPIIPCAVTGAEEIHPVLAKANWIGKPLGLPYFPITPTFPLLGLLGVIPLPTKWYIDFGEPIEFGEDAMAAMDNPLTVNRMGQEVRSVIQRMLNARLQRRASVWF